MSINIFPSNDSWVTPRCLEGQLTTNNCSIILPQKAEKVDRVLLNAQGFNVTIQYIDGNRKATTSLASLCLDKKGETHLTELDITKWVVEKAKYDTLTKLDRTLGIGETRLLWQNNTWYYKHNTNIITLCNDSIGGYVFKTPVFTSLIIGASSSLEPLYVKGSDGFMYEVLVIDLVTSIMNAQFRIYYTPLGESVKLQVPKTNPQVNQFCIPYSQQQPIVDNTTLGREMQSVANRAGCETKEVVRTCHSFAELRRPKDGWAYIEKGMDGKPTGNVWRLTAAHYSIYRDQLIISTETWSKNWSYRSDKVPINREFRSWNIPADIVQRNLLWQDYCLITRKSVSLTDNSLLSELPKTVLMTGLTGAFISNINATECNNLWFYTKDSIGWKHGVVLSCSAFGFGNSLVFSGKTQDNLSAGMQRVKSDDKDNIYQFCKDVYYCEEDGSLNNMRVQIGSSIYRPDTYLYPEYKEGGAATINGPEPDYSTTFPPSVILFKTTELDTGKVWNSFNVQKDPSEQLNFTYQLHLLTDDGFLVIGSTWAATNPLVKQRDKAQTIKVWKLTRHLPAGAQVMTASYGTDKELRPDLFTVDTSSANPSITFNPEGTINDGVGVCVTDENNAVLIAFNSNEPATFNVHFTHDYAAMAKALKAN